MLRRSWSYKFYWPTVYYLYFYFKTFSVLLSSQEFQLENSFVQLENFGTVCSQIVLREMPQKAPGPGFWMDFQLKRSISELRWSWATIRSSKFTEQVYRHRFWWFLWAQNLSRDPQTHCEHFFPNLQNNCWSACSLNIMPCQLPRNWSFFFMLTIYFDFNATSVRK